VLRYSIFLFYYLLVRLLNSQLIVSLQSQFSRDNWLSIISNKLSLYLYLSKIVRDNYSLLIRQLSVRGEAIKRDTIINKNTVSNPEFQPKNTKIYFFILLLEDNFLVGKLSLKFYRKSFQLSCYLSWIQIAFSLLNKNGNNYLMTIL
jgi:hypothetical protein